MKAFLMALVMWGTTWTVPTAYRTTAPEITEYVAEGVSIVEMEAAALFAVTTALGVESAAAVVISDVARVDGIEVEWRDTVQPLLAVLDAAIEACEPRGFRFLAQLYCAKARRLAAHTDPSACVPLACAAPDL